MPRTFGSLAELAQHLSGVPSRLTARKADALKNIGDAAAQTARNKLGVYQNQSGPFTAWLPLSPNTIIERIRMGFTPNDPLLRTGAMQRSIGSAVQGDTVTMGSADPKAVTHEKGGGNVPVRPFIGPAMFETEPMAKTELRKAVGAAWEG